MKQEIDYLIVGQGIAGTLLSYQLINKGYKVRVIDDNHESSSTIVAAGLINPLVLKRLTKTWRAEEFLAYNELHYHQLEKHLATKFYHKTPILKLINSEDEIKFWKHRSTNEEVKAYISDHFLDLSEYSFLKKFKGALVNNTAWIDTTVLLKAYQKNLIKDHLLIKESFNFNQLTIQEKTVEYNNFVAKHLIFCQGFKSNNNPFFDWIPLSLVKGELITIHSNEMSDDYIFNKKVFILPLGNNYYKIGATYDWGDLSLNTTKDKKESLLNDLNELIECKYTVIEQTAGIRPAVKDRRPVFGSHPIHRNISIVNGLGSRGLMMAPKLIEEFIDFQENGTAMDKEVDLKRYYSEFKPDSAY